MRSLGAMKPVRAALAVATLVAAAVAGCSQPAQSVSDRAAAPDATGAGAQGPRDGGLGPPDGGTSDGGSGGSGAISLPGRPDAGLSADLCAPPDAGPGDIAQAEPGLSTSCEGLATRVARTPSAVRFTPGTLVAGCRSPTSDGKGWVAFLMRRSAPSNYQPVAWLGAADGGLALEPTAAAAAPQPSGFPLAGAHLALQYVRHDVFFSFSPLDQRPLLLAD